MDENTMRLWLKDHQRLRIVGFNLEDAVVEWFRWMTRNGLITTWAKFEESVKNRFGPSKYEDPEGALSKLLQLGTVEDYQREFEKLMLIPSDHDELRIVVFPISLTEGARRWFDKTKESITCWVNLTAKFFGKYYPPSRIEGNNTAVIKWDPTNPRFEGWLATKFVNYKLMDIFTKGALWDYWKMGGDEIEVSDDESSDLEDYWSDKEEETAKIFKIETDVFYYETPLCLAFNEFNYLLKALEDGDLKDEALRNKAIMKGLISDDVSYNECWRRWKIHVINYHDYDEGEYENETHEEGHELRGIETREVPVCQIKRYRMIKYSFNDEEEYVVVKEDDYNDLTITSDEACRAYQEIF
ncbi:C2 calcium/lipid-binding domain-containing protein CaLB [Tanacetum coccineum]